MTIFAVRFDVFTAVLLRIQVCLLGCYTLLLDEEFPIFPRDVMHKLLINTRNYSPSDTASHPRI
jgi:hypothetical protein